MRGKIVILVVGGVAFVVGAGGAQSARVPISTPTVASSEAAAIPTPVETDAERRALLNARMMNMVRKGEGSRLADIETPKKSKPATSVASPAGRKPVLSVDTIEPSAREPARARNEPLAAFAPPTMRMAAPRRNTRGYIPPRLDLTTSPNIPGNDLECLTQAIYYEARNESEDGQAAVAEVVMNRTRSGSYPRSVCQVVYQRNSRTCQFTFTCDGSIGRGAVNMVSWSRAERIARDVYAGRSGLLPKTSVNYHANYVRPTWGQRLERVRQIGAHIFYGAAKSGQSTPGSSDRVIAPQASRGLQFVRIDALDHAFTQASSSDIGTSIPNQSDKQVPE